MHRDIEKTKNAFWTRMVFKLRFNCGSQIQGEFGKSEDSWASKRRKSYSNVSTTSMLAQRNETLPFEIRSLYIGQ